MRSTRRSAAPAKGSSTASSTIEPPPAGRLRAFARRLLRAALLDASAYRTVALDAAATGEALAVVALVAAAHALGALVRAIAFGWSPATSWIFGLVGEVAFWAAGGAAITAFGRLAFRSPATPAQVLRAFGFASAPGVLVLAAALASAASPRSERVVLPVLALWRLASGYVATREALRVGAVRSAVGLVAGVAAGLLTVGALGAAVDAVLPD